MAFKVMHAQHRFAQGIAQRLGHRRPHQQGAGQPRAFGIGDRVDGRSGHCGLIEHLLGERQESADVVTRGQLGDHAAEALVHRNLGMQCLRQQSALAVVERHAGFVAGGFDTERQHLSSLPWVVSPDGPLSVACPLDWPAQADAARHTPLSSDAFDQAFGSTKAHGASI